MKQQPEKHKQLERFKETAHQLGAEVEESAFKEKLGVIARQTPKSADSGRTKARSHEGKPRG